MSVKLINLNKIFKSHNNTDKNVRAVDNVNLEIKDGEMVTFLGPSGCGKTTTLRIISGFESPTSGEVWIDNKNVNDTPPNLRDTSMVFQSYAIFPHLSVSQNIGFGLELKGFPLKKIKKEVEKIMEIMNLKDLYNRRPDQLSGGQQQRVALARAIINKPKVLLFDEPLSNLDAKLREQMRDEIRRIQQEFKITSIYVTHDQSEAMTVSDRIVVMNEGKIMQVGTPTEIYSSPANMFVADFIGKVNLVYGKVKEINNNTVIVDYGTGTKAIKSNNEKFEKGQELITCVRPESLKLVKLDYTPKYLEEIISSIHSNAKKAIKKNNHGNMLLEGRIKTRVYLGPIVEYEIHVGKARSISAVVFNPIKEGLYNVGDYLGIDFPSNSARLLEN